MKQKTDEMPDEWVRQMLRSLPDTPPPGSAFDSERLWTQLRPELQQTPIRRRVGWAWWVVAAGFAGFVISWFGLNSTTIEQKSVATYQRSQESAKPITNQPKNELAAKSITSTAISSVKIRRKSQLHNPVIPTEKSELLQEATAVEQTEVVAQVPESMSIAELIPLVEKQPEPRKGKIASTTPKQRFKVVHENELRAEEEARPKLYPTQNFVRLGSGQREEASVDSRMPTLTMPLTHKPNH
ncbi:hypothetical protein GCM10028805_31550 [Spirosoma harenae]